MSNVNEHIEWYTHGMKKMLSSERLLSAQIEDVGQHEEIELVLISYAPLIYV